MRKTQEGGLNCVFFLYLKLLSHILKHKVANSIQTEVGSGYKMQERRITHRVILVPLTTRVKSSPLVLTRYFHYNHTILQFSQAYKQYTSLLTYTIIRLPCSNKQV